MHTHFAQINRVFLMVTLMGAAPASSQVTCEQFVIQSTLEGNTLTVSLDTDLPDNTTLMVSIDRRYWQSGSTDAYAEGYLSGRFTVGEWRDPRQVDVSDDVWNEALKKRQQALARFGDPFTVKRVSDDIEVDMTVPVNQSDPRFGRRNEQLTGSMVTTSSSGLRLVKASKSFSRPLGSASGSVNSATPVSARGLSAGRTYRLTGRTPLMPKREGRAAGDFDGIKYLEADQQIKVLERDESSGGVWYRVEASRADGAAIGAGWVNSSVLMRHEVVEAVLADNSYTRLGEIEDFSLAGATRLGLRIEVPLSRSRDQIEATLKKAVLDLYEERGGKPRAISAFAYMPGDDWQSAYTVGKAEYAPNGRWADATKSGRMAFAIEIGTAYFDVSRIVEDFAIGTSMRLRSSDSEPIEIYESTDGWSPGATIGRIQAGTDVEILDHMFLPMTSNTLLTWFRIKADIGGSEVVGWV